MASGKSEKPEKEVPLKKKVKGKSAKQSGNWFQRNKALITWALAIAFASTCIGFTGIAYVTQSEKEKKNKQGQEMKVDRIAENIKFWEDKLASSPGEPLNEGNLGYAYQESVFHIITKNRGRQMSDADKKQYSDHLKLAEDHYKKAIEQSGDKTYSFAAVNLAEVYLMKDKNEDAIKLLEDVIKKSGNDPKTEGETLTLREKLCFAYQKAGKNTEAIQEGELVIKGDPGNYTARVYMAKANYALKKPAAAQKLAEDAGQIAGARLRIASDPEMREHLYNVMAEIGVLMGDMSVDKKDYAKAQASYEMAKAIARETGKMEVLASVEEKIKKIAKFVPKETPKPSGAPAVTPSGSPGAEATPQATPAAGTPAVPAVTQTIPVGTFSIPASASPGAPITITPFASPTPGK